MRAMVLASADSSVQDHLALQELPAPQAAAGEVRLRVHACGVCHTDLHIVEGDLTLPRLPLVPGHQIVGVVDQVGAGVTRFRAGDRAPDCRGCAARAESVVTVVLARKTCASASNSTVFTRTADLRSMLSPRLRIRITCRPASTMRRPRRCCAPVSSATGHCG